MLPVVRSNHTVGVQVILYAWALVASTLLLIPVASMGILYTITALITGAWFVVESYRLYKQAIVGEIDNPMRLFNGSISYLTLLFVAIAIDPLFYFDFL
jgi:protoheme IX farnesyltransferase